MHALTVSLNRLRDRLARDVYREPSVNAVLSSRNGERLRANRHDPRPSDRERYFRDYCRHHGVELDAGGVPL